MSSVLESELTKFRAKSVASAAELKDEAKKIPGAVIKDTDDYSLITFLSTVNVNALTYFGNANYDAVIREVVKKISDKFQVSIPTAFQFAMDFGVHLNISGPGNANQKVFQFAGKKILLNDLFFMLGFKKHAMAGGAMKTADLKKLVTNNLTVAKVTRAFCYMTSEFLQSPKANSITPHFCQLNAKLPKRYGFLFACHLNMPESIQNELLISTAKFQDIVEKKKPWKSWKVVRLCEISP